MLQKLTAISKSPSIFFNHHLKLSSPSSPQNNETKNNVNEWQNVAYTKYNRTRHRQAERQNDACGYVCSGRYGNTCGMEYTAYDVIKTKTKNVLRNLHSLSQF